MQVLNLSQIQYEVSVGGREAPNPNKWIVRSLLCTTENKYRIQKGL